MKKTLNLRWPGNLSEITLQNLNMTELWFLRHTIDSGECSVANVRVHETKKFGHNDLYIDIEDQRYHIKHKTIVSGENFLPPLENIVYHVHKHNKLIGK